MGEISNTISTISAILFLASTAINIYLTMRLSKFENEMKSYIDERIKESKNDIRLQVLREIEIITDRLDRLDKRIDSH